MHTNKLKFPLFLTLFLLLATTSILTAQEMDIGQEEVSVEKSLFSVQTGLFGIWGNHEARLSNRIALRSEIGLDGNFYSGFYRKTFFALTPVVSLQPRWYYNLKKRHEKGKRIEDNSANFITVDMSYHPDLFVVSSYSDIRRLHSVTVIPSWGLRRNIGAHLNFEFFLGAGYKYTFAKYAGYSENQGVFAIDMGVRFGFDF